MEIREPKRKEKNAWKIGNEKLHNKLSSLKMILQRYVRDRHTAHQSIISGIINNQKKKKKN